MHTTVVGGTGFAGAAIVAEAARRGHDVTSFSRSRPSEQVAGVHYELGDVTDMSAVTAAATGADVIVGALSPRGALADSLRQVYRDIAHLADVKEIPLYIVGGYSSLRPADGADRFSTDVSHAPAAFHNELRTASAIVAEDLPATPNSLNWVFVSPALKFGAHVPGERTGAYRVGSDMSVSPDDGGAISGEDFAIGFVDLIEAADHRRAHLNLGY